MKSWVPGNFCLRYFTWKESYKEDVFCMWDFVLWIWIHMLKISAAFAAAQFKLQKCLFAERYIHTYTRINKRKQTKGAAMGFIWFLLDVKAQSSCRVENASGNETNEANKQARSVYQIVLPCKTRTKLVPLMEIKWCQTLIIFTFVAVLHKCRCQLS